MIYPLLGQGVSGKKWYTTDWGMQPFRQGSAPTREYIEGVWTEENPYNAKHPGDCITIIWVAIRIQEQIVISCRVPLISA